MAGDDRTVLDLYRLLGLLRRVQRADHLARDHRGQITGSTWTATTIYLTPTTLGAITFNFLMSLSGGLMVAYIVSKGNPFWTYSGGLAGIITASAGNDLYHPIQAFFIGGIGIYLGYYLHDWVERKFKIDDAVGAVAVHGYCGFIGVAIAGFMLWGYPSSPYEGYAAINPVGNFIGGDHHVLRSRFRSGMGHGENPRWHGALARAAAGRADGARFQVAA